MSPKSPNITTDQFDRSNAITPSNDAATRGDPQPRPAAHNLNPTAASLLGFLHAGPMTGWDLAASVQQSIGNFWNLSRSQIYRELGTAEAGGLVTASEAGPRERRPFAITEAGRQAFNEWISREPETENIRFPLLLTLYFAGQVPPARLRRFLHQHQLRHERQLEIYEERAGTVSDWASGPALTLRFGIEYERAVLRWFASLPEFGRSHPGDTAEVGPPHE